MLREAPELLVTVLVERVADAQVEGRRRALRVAGLLHPDEAAACLLLAALASASVCRRPRTAQARSTRQASSLPCWPTTVKRNP